MLAKKIKTYLLVLVFTLPLVGFFYVVTNVKNSKTTSTSVSIQAASYTSSAVPYIPITATSTNKSSKNSSTKKSADSSLVNLDDKTIYINNFPVKTGWLSSRFGMRNDPFNGKRKMHAGIDIAARKGTSVNPIGKGTVLFTGRKSGCGRTVEIQHGKTIVSRYCHLKKILTKKGAKVNTTDVIAQVGNSGRSTGPHLHLEVALNGERVNPQIFLIDKLVKR